MIMAAALFVLIVCLVVLICDKADKRKAEHEKTEAYIDYLETKVQGLERTVRQYRFNEIKNEGK